MKYFTLCGVLMVGLLCGCMGPSRKNPQPPAVSDRQEAAAAARWNNVSRDELERGRAVVISSCAKCHGYPSPTQESPDEWPAVANRMAKKAKLESAQTRAVTRYLVSASEVSR